MQQYHCRKRESGKRSDSQHAWQSFSFLAQTQCSPTLRSKKDIRYRRIRCAVADWHRPSLLSSKSASNKRRRYSFVPISCTLNVARNTRQLYRHSHKNKYTSLRTSQCEATIFPYQPHVSEPIECLSVKSLRPLQQDNNTMTV